MTDGSWSWRRMETGDIPSVSAIAQVVHPSFPEDDAVFAERVALYPAGCRILIGEAGAPQGYILSHPWRGAPPKLNSLLRALPAPDVYYIHDLSVLPDQRGSGAASQVVLDVLEQARGDGLSRAALVAVNHSVPFWSRLGFAIADDPAMQRALGSYGDDARYMVNDLAGTVA